MKTRERIFASIAALVVAACAACAPVVYAAPGDTNPFTDESGNFLTAPRNPNAGGKQTRSEAVTSPSVASSVESNVGVRTNHSPQPAILAATSASNEAVVFSDATILPTPAQRLVSGLPDDARPHGVGYFGRDNALISDFQNSRIFVVRISTAQVLATIDTSSDGYNGTGSIAIAPNLNAALAMGGSELFVIRGPFTASSSIATITMPGTIAGYQTQAIVFNNAGRAFVYHTAGISVLDAPYTSVAFTIPVSGNSSSGAIAISPDGNTLLTTTLSGNQVNIFQAPFTTATTSTAVTVPNGSGLDGIAVTPDGTKAIVVSAFQYHAAAISAPFSATSVVEQLTLPGGSFGGFEDVGISADSSVAILTGNSGGPPVFVRAPFTAASQTFAVPLEAGGLTGRGAGAVRFLPPGLAPGLTISKTAPASTAVGSNLTYTITYQNTGTANAANVIIRDPLPQGTTFVSATNGGTLTGGNVVFNVGTVNAGAGAQSVSFTVNVTAAAGEAVNNNNYTIEGTGLAPVPGPPVTTQLGGVIDIPTIINFTATFGAPGQVVIINGTNLTGATRVTFNGIPAQFVVNSPTRITAIVPPNATSGRIVVTTPAGTATSATDFRVAPRITSFSPGSGNTGTLVTVNGANFTNATRVTLAGRPVTFRLISPTRITFTVPANAASGRITVTTAAGTATSATDFLVPPRITSITPLSGTTGTTITVRRVNFQRTTCVTLGGQPVNFTLINPTTITFSVPDRASGVVRVTTPAGSATSTARFTNTTRFNPAIIHVLTPQGRVGSQVRLSGRGLKYIEEVRFNGVLATGVHQVTASEVVATVPAGAAGAIGCGLRTMFITAKTPHGYFITANTFTVIP